MGMMGQLDRDLRDALLELLVGVLLTTAAARSSRSSAASSWSTRSADLGALRRDAQEMIDAYNELPLEEKSTSASSSASSSRCWHDTACWCRRSCC